MKAKQTKTMRTCRLLFVLLACMLWPASEIGAQSNVNKYGVDTVTLATPGNHIYFGNYKHATEISEDRTTVTTREPSATPILWRVMGKETNDGAITLMSEYVLDYKQFHNLASGTWSSSSLNTWLNGLNATDPSAFPSNFTSEEKKLVTSNTVYAPAYGPITYDPNNESNSPNYILNTPSSTSDNTKFYLPWGTSNRKHTNGSKAFWTLGHNADYIPTGVDSMIVDDIKGAGLKGTTFNDDATDVNYWLRSMTDGERAIMVKPLGSIDAGNIDVPSGVRPIFRLNPDSVLFAYELKETPERLDQMMADHDNYRDDEGLPNGNDGNSFAYKLTIVDPSITLKLDTIFDLDDTIPSNGSGVICVELGGMFQRTVKEKDASLTINDSFVYKVVNRGGEVVRYGKSGIAGPIEVAAKKIYVDGHDEAGDMDEDYIDAYTAYIWAQKDNPTQSNKGSEPTRFTLKVRADAAPPELALKKVYRGHEPFLGIGRIGGDTAKVTFKIEEEDGGKYYYLVDPTSGQEPTSASALISAALQSDGSPITSAIAGTFRSGKQAFSGSGDHTITLFFGDNDEHVIYIASKDSVRKESNMLTITIPPYVPNTWPVSKDPTVYLAKDDEVILSGRDLADDPDTADKLTVTKILSDPALNKTYADTALIDGQLWIKAYSPGETVIKVVVDDHTEIPPTPPTGTDTVEITIAVREREPEVGINYLTEELTDFDKGAYYLISGDTIAMDTLTTWPIADKWFGTELSIVRIQLGKPKVSSTAQLLKVPARPAAPELVVTNESFNGYKDGQIYGVSTEMEYKLDTMNWVQIQNRRILENLAPGVYQVRLRVTDSTFVGTAARVTVREGVSWTPIMRIVSMPEVTGVTTSPKAGRHIISSTSDFPFSVKFSHSKMPTPVRTSRFFNGVQEVLNGVVNAEGGYDYVIRNVQEPVAIYLDPNVGNVVVDNEEQAVWSTAGQVYVKTERADTVVIYSSSGAIVKRAELPEGTTAIPLSAGLYIVTLEKSGIKRKVLIQ
jgi:hypothetical protein